MTTDPDPRRWRILAVLGAAFFMTILDSTIVVTALPSIGSDLGLSDSRAQWIITAYVLTYGGLMLLCGHIADRYGRRLLFIIGNALWLASSLLCGLAPSGELLIPGRSLQGLAAAVIAPAALSLVTVTFAEGAERNKALGIWGGLGGVGATAGLVLGGLLTQGLGWSSIFFVNVPVSIVVVAMAPLLLRESRVTTTRRGFDVAGAVTVTTALVLLVQGITQAPETGWAHPGTVGLLGGALLMGGLFVVVESRSSAPLVPFAALRSRVLVGGNLLIFTTGMAVDAVLITLTAYVQRELGWSAIQFGLLASVMTVMSVVAIVFTQQSVTRFGIRRSAMAGSLLLTLACLILVVAPVGFSPLGIMIAGLLIFGAGMGASFVSAQIAALTGVTADHVGLAAGLVDTSFHIGGGLGVAIATTATVIAGYQSAFVAATVIAVTAAVIAVTMFTDVVRKTPSTGRRSRIPGRRHAPAAGG